MSEEFTPEETVPFVEETVESEWPEIALFVNEEGKTFEPGDKGYDLRGVSRRITLAAKEAERSAKDLRALLVKAQKECPAAKPTLTNTQVIKASQAANRRAVLAQNAQKRELRDTLKDMGLLE